MSDLAAVQPDKGKIKLRRKMVLNTNENNVPVLIFHFFGDYADLGHWAKRWFCDLPSWVQSLKSLPFFGK
jgi:hypothetical protein